MSETGCISYNQIRSNDRQGAGAKIQMSAASSPVSGNVPIYDAGGSLVDSGSAPGGGGGGGGSIAIYAAATDPNGASWAWGDGPGSGGGAALLNTGTGYINLYKPAAGNADGLQSRVLTAAPSTPYTIELAFIPHFLRHESTMRVGFCFRDGAGKYVMFYLRDDGSGIAWELDHFTNATTGTAAVKTTNVDGGLANTQNGVWMKVTNDGSTFTFYIGTGLNTPNNWTIWTPEGATAFVASGAKPGFFLASSNNADVGMTVIHWNQY